MRFSCLLNIYKTNRYIMAMARLKLQQKYLGKFIKNSQIAFSPAFSEEFMKLTLICIQLFLATSFSNSDFFLYNFFHLLTCKIIQILSTFFYEIISLHIS